MVGAFPAGDFIGVAECAFGERGVTDVSDADVEGGGGGSVDHDVIAVGIDRGVEEVLSGDIGHEEHSAGDHIDFAVTGIVDGHFFGQRAFREGCGGAGWLAGEGPGDSCDGGAGGDLGLEVEGLSDADGHEAARFLGCGGQGVVFDFLGG
ncbi:MAG: hypothetical protein RI897_1881 [Verrucomicrobiota bacterium]